MNTLNESKSQATMIKIEKNKYAPGDYENLLFCEKAMMKDDSKYNLQSIKIDGGLAVTTDGHRLHLALLDGDYQDGVYRIVSRDKKSFILEQDQETVWPNYEIIFPTHKNFKEIEMAHETTMEKGSHGQYISTNYTRIIRNMNDDLTINVSFLDDFLGHEPFKAFIYESEKQGPVCFQNCNKLVLIMPMRHTHA